MLTVTKQNSLKVLCLFCCTILVSVAVMSYYFIVRAPLLQLQQAYNQQKLLKRQFASAYQTYLEQMALEKRLYQLQKRYKFEFLMLQRAFRSEQYIQLLAVIFKQHHVLLMNLKPQQVQSEKFSYVQIFKIQLQDQFGELIQALYAIQQLPYLSLIPKIEIKAMNNESFPGTLQANLLLKVYFQNEK